MIKTIIFDFGDVFINLDKNGALQNALDLFGIETFTEDLITTNLRYEIGDISTEQFINFYHQRFPGCTEKQIIDAWNYILKDFPSYRYEFIKALKQENRFNLILLSNTNEMHIEYIKHYVSFYEGFKSCFTQFYLSHEIHLRKPDQSIYEFVLNENHLKANECLFIDDTKENTIAAEQLGIHTWNIDETNEDVIELFNIQKHLFWFTSFLAYVLLQLYSYSSGFLKPLRLTQNRP